ncbi:TetR/AcrR family transcriptional regulator [Novosphingobium sp. M1R2S20]|uniref:TetR/AcrR family transcriptional regulator n=1 Tax=Novosphingobium rhizovicinum TaxID=3228928 RepID=A0ABV3RCX1_9SPHN
MTQRPRRPFRGSDHAVTLVPGSQFANEFGMEMDISTRGETRTVRPRGGRPTREQQRKRHDLLLSVALDAILEKGFEQTTIDEIVSVIGMSKRTVYALYKDKSALLEAALQRAVEDYTVPYSEVAALVEDDLRGTLTAIALMRIRNATTPSALRLQRILTAQAHRFPDLAYAAMMQGIQPAVTLLADLIRAHAAPGSAGAADPHRAATSFMSLAAGGPVRLSLLGHVLKEEEIKASVDYSVTLFLRGSGLESAE